MDGVYTADPEKDPAATKFDRISYDEVLSRGLKGDGPHGYGTLQGEQYADLRLQHGRGGNLRRMLEGDSVGTLVTVK